LQLPDSSVMVDRLSIGQEKNVQIMRKREYL
jgi:hypothetical protein